MPTSTWKYGNKDFQLALLQFGVTEFLTEEEYKALEEVIE